MNRLLAPKGVVGEYLITAIKGDDKGVRMNGASVDIWGDLDYALIFDMTRTGNHPKRQHRDNNREDLRRATLI